MRIHDQDRADEHGSRAGVARDAAIPIHPLLAKAAVQRRVDVLGTAGMTALQRSVGNTVARSVADPERSEVLDVISSGAGRPLDTGVRDDMETRLGHDFSDVRIHTDDAATRSAQSVNAHAYTVGSNVVFQRDLYDPGSSAGRTMLAHELTHVVQQRNGPVDGTETGTGIRVSDPSDRFEREASANAERVMAAPSAPVAQGAFVQRDVGDEPEEDSLQGSFTAQRDGEQPEEEDLEQPA